MLDRSEQVEQTLPTVYLLAIRGNLLPPTLEVARTIHNETAGAPANVAAARALGDLSHMVYVPTDRPKSGAGEFLILDLWNSMNGLSQFFANPQVQEQGGRIFRSRDPVVWAPAEGFNTYHYPAPSNKTERIVAIVRGMVPSRAEARKRHNSITAKQVNKSRMSGNMSHEAYFKLAPPGTRDTRVLRSRYLDERLRNDQLLPRSRIPAKLPRTVHRSTNDLYFLMGRMTTSRV